MEEDGWALVLCTGTKSSLVSILETETEHTLGVGFF